MDSYCGWVFCFADIRANDTATAFATSIGSKALAIKQAVIFETYGAILMGNHTTNTIRKGISNYKCYDSEGDLLMYGYMWVI